MKKWILVLCTCYLLSLCIVGVALTEDPLLRGYEKGEGYVYLQLGHYPQTVDGDVLPILWRVLDTDSEKAFLLSEYILFARSLHTSLTEYQEVLRGDFAGTELCHYLNTDFAADAFTDDEMAMLLPCENFGKVFLLSREDMMNKEYGLGITNVGTTSLKKIKENPGVRAWGTEWAIMNNGFPQEEYPNPKARITGRAGANISVGEIRLYVYPSKYAKCSPWWGRTQSITSGRQAICTKGDGEVGRIEAGRDNEGVRPALYLDKNAFKIKSGVGTKEDPYVLVPVEIDSL